jgi:glycosyltransferase involved in cell wall biosynthesis
MRALLFDLRATQLLSHGHHGGAEYARAVFHRLLATPGELRIRAFHDTGRPLPEDVAAAARGAGVELIGVKDLRELQGLIAEPGNERFYSALPYEYADIDLLDLDVILTIHGLRPIEMPSDAYSHKYASTLSQFAMAHARRWLAGPYRRYKLSQFARLLGPRGRRRRLIVPSEHTKHAILLHFPSIGPEEILVCYSPRTSVCDRQDTDPALLESIGLTDRGYVLLVSTNRWEKNSYRAIKATEELFERCKGVEPKRIVGVGGAPPGAPRRWQRQHVFVSGLDARSLATLYRHAFVLLYPSLNEGFGYPPLESMSYGTPVIASASTAIPEISGAGAVYVTPYSIDEMQNRLLWLLGDAAAWARCSAQARERFNAVSLAQERMLAELCRMLVGSDG